MYARRVIVYVRIVRGDINEENEDLKNKIEILVKSINFGKKVLSAKEKKIYDEIVKIEEDEED